MLRKSAPYLVAIAISVFISSVTWPGFLSWDSLHALEEARQGVMGGDYPPLVSYVWRVFDAVAPGPALMLFFQNALALCAVAHFLRLELESPLVAALAVLLIALCPCVMGPMLVVWKDTLMLGLFFLAIATLRSSGPRWLSAVALLLAGATRLNAIFAAVPLWWWWARFRSSRALVGMVTGAVLAFGLQHYRLPSLEPLSAPNPRGPMLFDILGTSHFARENLLPQEVFAKYEAFSIDDIDRIYHPEHLNLALEGHNPEAGVKPLSRDAASVGEVTSAWLRAIRRHPVAYVRHRLAVTARLLGIDENGAFYPTHYGIAPNSLELEFHPNRLTGLAVGWVKKGARTPLGSPWLPLLIGLTLLFAISILRPLEGREPVAILASGLLYVIAFLPLAPAADARYSLYAVVTSLAVGASSAGRVAAGYSRDCKARARPRISFRPFRDRRREPSPEIP